MAVHRRMPIVAAVKRRGQLARRRHILRAVQNVADLVRIFLPHASERELREPFRRRRLQRGRRFIFGHGRHAKKQAHPTKKNLHRAPTVAQRPRGGSVVAAVRLRRQRSGPGSDFLPPSVAEDGDSYKMDIAQAACWKHPRRLPSCSASGILHSDAPARLAARRRARTPRTGHGWVAQLVEQRTENPRVGGSIPSPATIFLAARHLFAL